MDAAEIRSKVPAELQKELLERLKEQFNLRMQLASGQLAKPDQIRKVRRDIARIKTVLNEKARAGNAQ
jgi:large subunit ribosomal protein L29